MRLRNRIALITGAAQGIGAAIAGEFAKEGAIVYIIDRGAHIQHVARELETAGGKCVAFQFDLRDYDALEACVKKVVANESGIDILVNNAAICYYEDLFDSSIEHWREIQAVNIEAQYAACKLVAPYMARRKWGRIVNIASTQAIATEPRVGAYAASKGAIISFTKSLAIELAPYGIHANAIAPGCIHTPMSVINGVDETTTELFQTWYVRERKIPLGRPGEASEIARVAVFLASDDASYVTGHTLVVDGGLTITF
jgi:NAD(P)-dependent dehydrogenase (short-subunit alcohol dehydrogenase family)